MIDARGVINLKNGDKTSRHAFRTKIVLDNDHNASIRRYCQPQKRRQNAETGPGSFLDNDESIANTAASTPATRSYVENVFVTKSPKTAVTRAKACSGALDQQRTMHVLWANIM